MRKRNLSRRRITDMKISFDMRFIAICIAMIVFTLCAWTQDNKAIAFDKNESINPRVAHSLNALLELIKDPNRKITLKRSQVDWLHSRENHCKSIVDSGHAALNAKLIKECLTAFDRTRIDFLNHQRIQLLLDMPPLHVPLSSAVRISYSPETTYRPSHPRSLVVAATAPVAAVTFEEMTEVFDLSNGRLISRFDTLDADSRAGQYDHYLTPNGRILVVSYLWPKAKLKIWDANNGDLLFEKGVSSHIHRCLMSEGRQFVFTEGRGKIGVYDIGKDEATWYAESPNQSVNVALAPDDRWLVVVRQKEVEAWERATTNDRISYVLKTSTPRSPYSDSFQWVVVSRDSASVYGSIPSSGRLVEWSLPEMKVVRRLRFPNHQSVKLMRIPQSGLFLMEAFTRKNNIEAFVVDMASQTAARLYDHFGKENKMAPLWNRTILIASPFLLKAVAIPESKEFLPFQQVFGVTDETVSSGTPQPKSPKPYEIVREDCSGFQTEAISVYQGTLPAGVKSSFKHHPTGTVKVNIGKTNLPVKLVLSSYEPVAWRLNLTSDARLSEVFLSGSNESRIEGKNITQITFIGNNIGYRKRHSPDFGEIVKTNTGCTITRLQHSYTGHHFYIGEISPYGNSGIVRHVDEHGNITYRDN